MKARAAIARAFFLTTNAIAITLIADSIFATNAAFQFNLLAATTAIIARSQAAGIIQPFNAYAAFSLLITNRTAGYADDPDGLGCRRRASRKSLYARGAKPTLRGSFCGNFQSLENDAFVFSNRWKLRRRKFSMTGNGV